MTATNDLLIRAAFKQPIERTPVWVMRQAGRYLSEYRATRAKAGSFLELCKNVELAAEVTIQPLDLIEVDAVILFSDILTPLEGMGLELSFDPSPKFANPIRTQADIEALRVPDPDQGTPYVGKILNLLQKEVAGRVPIIGFAGAPFTLACYAIEGEGSKLFSKTKALFFDQPALAHKLMEKLTQMTINYLNYQIENGAQMVQLFDTWAGSLCPDDYDRFVFPYVQRIFAGIKQPGKVPKVYYINGGSHLLTRMARTGCDVVGLDWMSDLKEAKDLIGGQVGLQGNLDPNVLFAGEDYIRSQVKSILEKWGPQSGHIFNLGHGIDKDVNPDHLRAMVRAVKELSKR
ncbi:MAG: uroporphyrinogen decarboxylase [Candidatus Lambdaproteobacteria bacterium RIFOXYD1_FULL_56_27]|uniref:Uroporphyrinogen decarboxylase n=1 Tax=Candidatus Lambdaproteobacteria bacterium RIFOXYD2_FULL_56_26 TaxID=1817773 RepID=A0A1F6H2R8_9PROT|nr:MAG: uroporphyrinogen decarboxylase [Candidatus Lambdaproteobacteria bacterium RIFOXYC1_FULL_56_13]OGH04669.1 MAG: uroporphyrinogen decarboxylase [Candidatus Lambdaproteobacteria bacterium RIFOXYD2_FULL_56_26]OGH09133.1 MAG: uroporphyrinogen decarboxylase [Candidatus Lambdaproteobacteria bacterium RIFOXYD1_FULL_56_27]